MGSAHHLSDNTLRIDDNDATKFGTFREIKSSSLAGNFKLPARERTLDLAGSAEFVASLSSIRKVLSGINRCAETHGRSLDRLVEVSN